MPGAVVQECFRHVRPDPRAASAIGLAAILLLIAVGVAFVVDSALFSRRAAWTARFASVTFLDAC